MAIIARRIPHGLGYISAHTVRGGLGESSCPPGFHPSISGSGCAADAKSAPTPQPEKPSFLTNVMSAIIKPPAAPGAMPAAPVRAGMSTNTKIAIGVGVVGLAALVLIATRK